MSQLQINHTILKQRFPHVATKINSLPNDDLSIPLFTESFERDIAWLNAVEGLLETGKLFLYMVLKEVLALLISSNCTQITGCLYTSRMSSSFGRQ